MTALFNTRLNADVLLRGAAIIMVVFNHALDSFEEADAPFEGGVTILLMLSGYLFARFVLSVDDPILIRRALTRLGFSIFWPSFIFLLLSFLIRQEFSLSELFYVYSWIGEQQIAYYMSWYIETLLQIFLITGLMFAVPTFRTWFFKSPFVASAGVFVLAFILHFLGTPPIWPRDDIYPLPLLFMWNFVLGWVLYFGTQKSTKSSHAERDTAGDQKIKSRQVLIQNSFVLALSAISLFGITTMMLLPKLALFMAVILMVWQPKIFLPRPVVIVLSLCSQASFTIFLLHLPMFGVYRTLTDTDSATLCASFSVFMSLSIWVAVTATKRAFNRISNPIPLHS